MPGLVSKSSSGHFRDYNTTSEQYATNKPLRDQPSTPYHVMPTLKDVSTIASILVLACLQILLNSAFFYSNDVGAKFATVRVLPATSIVKAMTRDTITMTHDSESLAWVCGGRFPFENFLFLTHLKQRSFFLSPSRILKRFFGPSLDLLSDKICCLN